LTNKTLLLGVQLYSLRQELLADFDGTMQAVAGMGFNGVEPWGGLPVSVSHAADLFQSLGLQTPSAHLPLLSGEDGPKALEAARTYNLQTIVLPYLPPEHFSDRDSLARTAALINENAHRAQDAGFAYGYHNHWWELADLDGTPALYHLIDLLDPTVLLEIDVYWVAVAGLSPADVLSRLGTRAALLHLKDGPADKPESPMLAAGTGRIDFHALLTQAQADWGFVELDACATDMLQAVRQSATYLLSSGLAKGKA
jgi:sugar phosphate isomerase/epimerase